MNLLMHKDLFQMEQSLRVFKTFIDKKNDPHYEIFSPYRVSPIGAHSDHQKGTVTGFTLNYGLKILISSTQDRSIQLLSLDFQGLVTFKIDSQIQKKQGNWGDYVRGAVIFMKKKHNLTKGIKGVIKGSIPVGGISSSAAILCGIVLGLSTVNQLNLSKLEIIDIASNAERQYVGLRNGILDQGCIMLSEQKRLLTLNTKTQQYQNLQYGNSLQNLPFQIGVICSGVSRNLTQTSFNTRVSECKAAAWMLYSYENMKLKQFQDTYLGDITKQVYQKHKDKMPQNFRKRAEHFFTQEDRLVKGIDYWKNGDIHGFGNLLYESCQSLVVNYECGSPELIALNNILKETNGVFGARFSGAGFKGHCIALIDPSKKQQILERVTKQYLQKFPQYVNQFKIFFSDTSKGISIRPFKSEIHNNKITNIILAAGYATRMYPLTQNFPKPLLPIGNTTILDRLIDDLENVDQISRHIVVTNHKYAHTFQQWAKSRLQKNKKPIYILDDGTSTNQTRLGAVSDLLLTIEKYSINQDILVMAADNILDFSLKEFTNKFLQSDNSIIMAYEQQNTNALRKSGVIKIDQKMRVIGMQQKPQNPQSNYCVPAFYGYKKKDLFLIKQSIKNGCEYDAPGNLVSYLHTKTLIQAWIMPGKRMDVGSLQNYKEAQEQFNDKK